MNVTFLMVYVPAALDNKSIRNSSITTNPLIILFSKYSAFHQQFRGGVFLHAGLYDNGMCVCVYFCMSVTNEVKIKNVDNLKNKGILKN